MAFQSITKGLSRTGRKKGSGHPSRLTIKGIKGKRSPSGEIWQRDRLLFRIARSLWEQAELEPSEKVEVLFDKEQMLGLITPSEDGYTLTIANSRGNIANDTFDVFFAIPHFEETGFPYFEVQTGMEDIEVNDGKIQFRIPAQTAPTFNSLSKRHQGKPRKGVVVNGEIGK